MKLYLAGKITGDFNCQEKFHEAAARVYRAGHIPMYSCGLPQGYDHSEYLHICYAMIDVCDAVCLLPDYTSSKGAAMEAEYAQRKDKPILRYQDIAESVTDEEVEYMIRHCEMSVQMYKIDAPLVFERMGGLFEGKISAYEDCLAMLRAYRDGEMSKYRAALVEKVFA